MNEHHFYRRVYRQSKGTSRTGTGKKDILLGELSRVALERTKTAREAIKLMGELIEKYGYTYG